MGLNTLPTATSTGTIPTTHHNGLVDALKDDFVPRDTTTKAPTDIAGDLGSTSYRWDKGYVKELWVGDPSGAYLKETGTKITSLSASSGAFTTVSATVVDVTNLSVSFTSTGRPAMMMLVPDGSTSGSVLGLYNGTTPDTAAAVISFLIDGTIKAETRGLETVATGVQKEWPLSFSHIDIGRAAGTYTYKIQLRVGSAGDVNTESWLKYAKLLVYEL